MNEAEEIAEAVVGALERSRSISDETHHHHHDYIDALINRDTKRAEMYDQIKVHVAKFGALGIFGAVAMAVWHYFTEMINNGIHPQ